MGDPTPPPEDDPVDGAPGRHLARCADLHAIGAAAATAALEVCRARQAEAGIPALVLTGGRAGAEVLRAIAGHPDRDLVDWSRVRFLWGDERWLPAGDAERNDRLADETLFAAVGTDPALVHRIATSDSGIGLDDAARAYATLVDGIGRIDLAMNGVGEDGHIASLFPDGPGLPDGYPSGATGAAAIAVRDSPKPPPERVSLSFAALERADRVWLFASGHGKAGAVRAIIDRWAATSEASARTRGPRIPAALVTGRLETVLWSDAEALETAADFAGTDPRADDEHRGSR